MFVFDRRMPLSIRGETKRMEKKILYVKSIFLIPCCFEDFVTSNDGYLRKWRSSVGNEEEGIGAIFSSCSSPISTIRISNTGKWKLNRGKHTPAISILWFIPRDVFTGFRSSEIYLFFKLFSKINKLVFFLNLLKIYTWNKESKRETIFHYYPSATR